MVENPVNGRYSLEVFAEEPWFHLYVLTLLAIDFIKQQKQDMQRMSEMVREANGKVREHEPVMHENTRLREEVTSLWQVVRRLEPNNQHVFGPYTAQLAQENGSQQNLPRLPPPQTHWNPPPPPSNMMQGVEYNQPGHQLDRR